LIFPPQADSGAECVPYAAKSSRAERRKFLGNNLPALNQEF